MNFYKISIFHKKGGSIGVVILTDPSPLIFLSKKGLCKLNHQDPNSTP